MLKNESIEFLCENGYLSKSYYINGDVFNLFFELNDLYKFISSKLVLTKINENGVILEELVYSDYLYSIIEYHILNIVQ